MTIFAWNVPLVSLIFLKKSLVFAILLFSSISLYCSPRKAFLSLLAILWNSAFRWIYLDFFPWRFPSLLFSAIYYASDNHFAFLHFFFLGMVLITASCTMLWISTHSSSGILCIRSDPLNLFVRNGRWVLWAGLFFQRCIQDWEEWKMESWGILCVKAYIMMMRSP